MVKSIGFIISKLQLRNWSEQNFVGCMDREDVDADLCLKSYQAPQSSTLDVSSPYKISAKTMPT
jgi:hypothetical protein